MSFSVELDGAYFSGKWMCKSEHYWESGKIHTKDGKSHTCTNVIDAVSIIRGVKGAKNMIEVLIGVYPDQSGRIIATLAENLVDFAAQVEKVRAKAEENLAQNTNSRNLNA